MDEIRWRIYYAGGETFDNTQAVENHSLGWTAEQQAPSTGFLIAVYYDHKAKKRMLMHGWDHFYFHPIFKEWWGCNLQGLLDVLRNNLPAIAFKEGRNVSNSEWQETLNRADKDPDFPPDYEKARFGLPYENKGVEHGSC